MSENGNGPQVEPMDNSNHLLTETPARMWATPVTGPMGSRLMLTVRTPSTTLTILLAKDDATNWGAAINSGVAQMSGLILPSGAGGSL